MNNMFSGCTELTTLDLRSFNTANVVNMSHMFYFNNFPNSKLSKIIANFDTSKVTKSEEMFNNCKLLPNYDSSRIDVSMAKSTANGGYFTQP